MLRAAIVCPLVLCALAATTEAQTDSACAPAVDNLYRLLPDESCNPKDCTEYRSYGQSCRYAPADAVACASKATTVRELAGCHYMFEELVRKHRRYLNESWNAQICTPAFVDQVKNTKRKGYDALVASKVTKACQGMAEERWCGEVEIKLGTARKPFWAQAKRATNPAVTKCVEEAAATVALPRSERVTPFRDVAIVIEPKAGPQCRKTVEQLMMLTIGRPRLGRDQMYFLYEGYVARCLQSKLRPKAHACALAASDPAAFAKCDRTLADVAGEWQRMLAQFPSLAKAPAEDQAVKVARAGCREVIDQLAHLEPFAARVPAAWRSERTARHLAACEAAKPAAAVATCAARAKTTAELRACDASLGKLADAWLADVARSRTERWRAVMTCKPNPTPTLYEQDLRAAVLAKCAITEPWCGRLDVTFGTGVYKSGGVVATGAGDAADAIASCVDSVLPNVIQPRPKQGDFAARIETEIMIEPPARPSATEPTHTAGLSEPKPAGGCPVGSHEHADRCYRCAGGSTWVGGGKCQLPCPVGSHVFAGACYRCPPGTTWQGNGMCRRR